MRRHRISTNLVVLLVAARSLVRCAPLVLDRGLHELRRFSVTTSNIGGDGDRGLSGRSRRLLSRCHPPKRREPRASRHRRAELHRSDVSDSVPRRRQRPAPGIREREQPRGTIPVSVREPHLVPRQTHTVVSTEQTHVVAVENELYATNTRSDTAATSTQLPP